MHFKAKVKGHVPPSFLKSQKHFVKRSLRLKLKGSIGCYVVGRVHHYQSGLYYDPCLLKNPEIIRKILNEVQKLYL
jgi:hypothetical protein